MKISILTLFPELYTPFLGTSLIRRAQDNGHVGIAVRSLFEFCAPKERADGPIFGHGAGMVLRPEVIERAVVAQEASQGEAFKIFFSPHGTTLNQTLLGTIYERIRSSAHQHCMLLPARYEGMDARIEDEYADLVISLGDFVLMGGDLPAMTFLEGLLRFVPGIVGKSESVERDSFSGAFVDYPHYTAPVEWHGRTVPEIVRSGNHAAQEVWRQEQAVERTVLEHFDWLRTHHLSDEQRRAVVKHLPPHYIALMHTDVQVHDDVEGNSSVTSIDLHDIARSAATFGLKNYFVVTPLVDQQKIVSRLLSFWQEGEGVTYNPSRHEAVSHAQLATDLDDVITRIEKAEGNKPLVVGTSAKIGAGEKRITYNDQAEVWRQNRPVLLVLGTARGLSTSILKRCDYILEPIEGLSAFNHLSVRSAAAIICDRWLGISLKRRIVL